MSMYKKVCEEALASIDCADIDWRHLEGFMRLEYGTLSHLPRSRFVTEARLLAVNWDEEKNDWERNAQSYGL
jgi:hypothetical protein